MKASQKLRCLKGGGGGGGWVERNHSNLDNKKKIRVFEKLRADLWADKENTLPIYF